jgi:CHAT domain-containing protein
MNPRRAVALCAVVGALACARDDRPAVVLEEVLAGWSGDRAGLRPGDEVLDWRRAEASGRFDSPFDVPLVEQLEGDRGPVTVRVRREGRLRQHTIQPGIWGLVARSSLSRPELRSYLAALEMLQNDGAVAGGQRLSALAEHAASGGRPIDAAWLHYRWASALGLAHQPAAAVEARLEAARALLERQPGSDAVLAWLHQRAGWLAAYRHDLARAEAAHEAALSVWERVAPQSLAAALDLELLAAVLEALGREREAEELVTRALAWRRKSAPEGLGVAASLDGLGRIAARQGDGVRALELQSQALRLRRSLAPESLETAASLHNVGETLRRAWRLAEAEEHLLLALALRERLNPEHHRIAFTLMSLGGVASRRGDWPAAARLQRRACDVLEERQPGSLSLIACWLNLGEIAEDGGDLAVAADRYRAALALALEIAPDNPFVAVARAGLARVASVNGDRAAAEELYGQALVDYEQSAPSGTGVAEVLQALGELAEQGGETSRAIALVERALAIRRRLAPGSLLEAESEHALGLLRRSRGQLDDARASLTRAVAAVDEQLSVLGGSTVDRARFRARHDAIYSDYVDLLLELGEPSRAFAALDASRARALLVLAGSRELRLETSLPAPVERERRNLVFAEHRARERLGRLSLERQPRQVEQVAGELAELRRRRVELEARIAELAPYLGTPVSPDPDAGAVDGALDPGTLLLAYHLGQERGHLFVLPASARLRVVEIPVGADELRAAVERLRLLVETEPPAAVARGALHGVAETLYQLLVAPAGEELERAERLVVVPDGPLHLLPFALLRRGDSGSTEALGNPYLVELLPVHQVASASALAALRDASRHRDGAARLEAFGDVRPGGAGAGSARRRDGALDGLPALPATRHEVRAIVEAWGPDAIGHVRDGASEERVYTLGPETRYLHFATHGILDERLPLESAILLSRSRTRNEEGGSGEDGVLHAREVLERVRVDAELVTLSACDTGLGAESRGEGLLGLTRAFQSAGARSVVASLWQVRDRSTAALMVRFYEHLRDGMPKDEALRQAQLGMLRGRDLSHPHHWAAFQLYGDWR